MVRKFLGDPTAPLALKRGDKVASPRGDGKPDPHQFGRVVDGWCDVADTGSGPYTTSYTVEMDGHPEGRFSVQEFGYVVLSDDDFVRLRLQRKWREGLLVRHRRVAERLEPGKTPSTAILVGTGSGEACEACDEPILPTHGKVSYTRASGPPMYLHRRCDELWDELEFGTS